MDELLLRKSFDNDKDDKDKDNDDDENYVSDMVIIMTSKTR